MTNTLSSIKKLENFGIFYDYQDKKTNSFEKRNLIFGWNGTGKSTLSKLFRCIELKSAEEVNVFANNNFALTCSDKSEITNDNVHENKLPILTFNKSFVEENIDWNNILKSILIIDKEKIDDTARLSKLANLQNEETTKLDAKQTQLKDKKQEIDNFCRSSASTIKNVLRSVSNKDSQNLRYDKRNFITLIDKTESELKSPKHILSEESLNNTLAAAKSDLKESIPVDITPIKSNKIDKLLERVKSLLTSDITTSSISRLKENSDIQQWVKEGLEIHSKHGDSTCEFCKNRIEPKRLEEINNHFSTEFVELLEKVELAEQWLPTQKLSIDSCPKAEGLYEELLVEYNNELSKADTEFLAYNDWIDSLEALLKEKKSNPFKTDFQLTPLEQNDINRLNTSINSILSVLTRHNKKHAAFDQEVKKCRRALELHYASQAISEFNYFEKITNIETETNEIEKLEKSITKRLKAIQTLQHSLSSEGLGADDFNKSLHKFLGRNDPTPV